MDRAIEESFDCFASVKIQRFKHKIPLMLNFTSAAVLFNLPTILRA